MKKLKHIIEGYKAKNIGTEAHMWKSVELIDDMILCPLMESHPDIYWDFMREIHVIYMGAHYNEEFAKWEVEQMHHKGDDGVEYKGQHWSMEDAAGVYAKYKSVLKPKDTVADMYVALNAMYHDACKTYKKWFADKYEEHIIEWAIEFYFKDEDAPDSKIWYYFEGLREAEENK